MRRYFLGLLASLLLSPLTMTGQTTTVSSPVTPDPRFAAINNSLMSAADSVLEAAAPPRLPENPLVHTPNIPIIAAGVPAKIPSQRTRQVVDVLRPLIQPILSKEGVPDQLAAVIRVESGGNPLALSPKGARGLWQLMPDTARRYGLRVDERLDERLDLEKSTTGAARYLRDLYAQFGSWPLALAAYNTGEQNLQKAIERAHSRDFSTLSALGYLPSETRNYVPAVLSAIGSQLPSEIQPTLSNRPTHFVYATSEESRR